ncbi:MAG: hypothetical protein JW754_03435, partial [Candidatus Aenigmarchaeota archaeon]|nr:hypothetical protein [Candidatus Aenigmarchaeota archaeon]
MENVYNFLKKHYWVFCLIFILLVAFYLRGIPGTKLTYPQLQAIDPYFFFRMGEYYIENGQFPENDYLARWGTYPGGPDRTGDFPLTTLSYLVLYYTLNPFTGIDWYFIGVWGPAFFGMLQVLFIYFLGKELFNKKEVGLLAAASLAFVPGILYRVSAGFIEKEPIGGVLMVIGLIFFVKAFKEKTIEKNVTLGYIIRHPLAILHKTNLEEERIKTLKTVLYGFLAGVFLVLMANTTSQVRLVWLMIGAFVMISLLLNKYSKRFMFAHLSAIISYFVLSYATVKPMSMMDVDMIVNFAAVFFFILRYAVEKYNLIKKEYIPMVVPGIFIFFVFAVLIFSYINIDTGIWLSNNMARISNPISYGVISSTVAESQTAGGFMASTISSFGNQNAIGYFGLPDFFIYFSLIYFSFVAIIVMIYEFLFRERKLEFIFVIVFFFIMMQLAIGAIRLSFIFAFPVALTAAYCLYRGSEFVIRRTKNLRGEKFNYMKVVVGVSLGLVLVTGYTSGWLMASNIGTSLDDSWYNSLIWLRDNTAEDAVVLEWWDYGWWFHYVGKKITLVDGGYHDQVPTQDIAKFYTEPISNRSLNFLKHYNITYVMVSPDLIPKFGAMSKIANWGAKVDVLPTFTLTNNYQEGSKTLLEYSLGGEKILFAYNIVQEANYTGMANITAMIKSGMGQAYISHVGIGNQVIPVEKPNSIDGMAYMAGNAVVFIPGPVRECMFVRLYLFDAAGLE